MIMASRSRPGDAARRRLGRLLCPAIERLSAARASRRVESSVGSGEFVSFMISGISVQLSATASQPSAFSRPITFWK